MRRVVPGIRAPLLLLLFTAAVFPGSASGAGTAALDLAAEAALKGDGAAAIREYEAFAKAEPTHRLAPMAIYAAANLRFLETKDYEGAIGGYDRVLAEHAGSPWAAESARRKAESLAALERWTEAGDAYADALRYTEGIAAPLSAQWTTEVSVGAADCFARAGDPARTVTAYEKVLERPLPPQTTATILMRLGEASESSGRAARAADSYVRVVREYPYTEHFQQAAAKRDLIAGHVTLDWTPYDAYGRASRQVRAGDFAGAIAACDTVMALAQDAPVRASAEYVRTVSQMMQSGDFEGGSERLTAFVEANPEFRGLAGVERTMQLARNVASAQAGARDRAEDAGAQRALGQAFLNARLFQRALEPLEKARALAPADMGTQMMLGGAYVSTRQFDKAEEAFKNALETDPDNTTTLNLIGYAYLGRGAAEQAIPHFERYAELAPDDPNSHDSLGEGYLGAGRIADAIREYEKAVEIDPGFANSHFMLGSVYQQAGQPEKALPAYRRFLQLSPTGPQADQAREAIREIESR